MTREFGLHVPSPSQSSRSHFCIDDVQYLITCLEDDYNNVTLSSLELILEFLQLLNSL